MTSSCSSMVISPPGSELANSSARAKHSLNSFVCTSSVCSWNRNVETTHGLYESSFRLWCNQPLGILSNFENFYQLGEQDFERCCRNGPHIEVHGERPGSKVTVRFSARSAPVCTPLAAHEPCTPSRSSASLSTTTKCSVFGSASIAHHD
jgi:hypothetical protein